jgi:hypothetical protein
MHDREITVPATEGDHTEIAKGSRDTDGISKLLR